MEAGTRDNASLLVSSSSTHTPRSENGHVSNFHALVAKLIREYEQTVFAFNQEVEHLRAVCVSGPTKQNQPIVSNQQANLKTPPQVSWENHPADQQILLGKQSILPKGSQPGPLARKQDLCGQFGPGAAQLTETSVDLDEMFASLSSKHLSDRKLHPTFNIEPMVRECSTVLVDGSPDSSQGLRNSINSAVTSTTTGRSAFTNGKLSVKTPQATMNWNLEDLPTQDLWAAQVAEFLSRRCPTCCIEQVRGRVEQVLAWWENLKEPRRSSALHGFLESNPFQFFILGVIFLNTIFVIITTNLDMHYALISGLTDDQSETTSWRVIAEASFTVVYCIELMLKFKVHGMYLFSEADVRWNLFDSVLVIFSVVDLAFQLLVTSSSLKRPNLTFLRALRILKFARVLRMVRLVKCIHELKLMMDCILNSVFHLFWSVILIFLVLIMFALIIVQGMRDYVIDDVNAGGSEAQAAVKDRFDTVQQTMLSLYMATTGGVDWGDEYETIGEAGRFFEIVYVFYISFFTIVAWNIVMSTFVEKAFRLAMPDFESTVMEKRQQSLAYAKELTNLLVSKLDTDHDGYISLHEFQSHITDKNVKDFFAARDLNLKDAELFFRMLMAVEHTNEVNVNTFVGACLRLRGLATAIDLQTLHFEVRNLYQKQEKHIKSIEHLIESTLGTMSANTSMKTTSMKGVHPGLTTSKSTTKARLHDSEKVKHRASWM